MTTGEKLMPGEQELRALYDLSTSNYRRFGTYSMLVYEDQQQIEFVDALPRNPVGKIDKKELRKHHVH